VRYCQEILPAGNIRAILTNSGQANAATGAEGVERNLAMADAVAKELKVKREQVLVASTGRIGVQVESEKVIASMPELVERASNVAEGFALAILTTDLVPKSVTTTVKLSRGKVRITGICKGSGMIHPQMATMLGYILTDAKLSPALAQSLLVESTNVSFNMISVDGDCSTNDSNYLLASGATGIEPRSGEDLMKFKRALIEVSQFLAKAIAADGEGATKLVEVELKGAHDLTVARRAARGAILSPLVKCAIHGEDPNWGRILSRLGAEQVPATALDKLVLKLQGLTLYKDGRPVDFDREKARALLKTNKVQIEIDLKSGTESATAWGCDLSKKYVDINTEYT
jgi:glutamate N-acetyltransferase/amino-acid N-acetyltransferase